MLPDSGHQWFLTAKALPSVKTPTSEVAQLPDLRTLRASPQGSPKPSVFLAPGLHIVP